MTSKFNIDNRELLQRISSGEAVVGIDFGNLIVRELAAFRLAAMDSESECLPLDYLQGHKDGLEWAAQLAEANHPETGDWLYDDPIELAKAIRKGPDMPPAQSVADSEPVIVVGDDGGDALSYRRLIQSFEPGTKLYRHAQPVPVVSTDLLHTAASAIEDLLTTKDRAGAGVWFDLPFRLRSAANAQPAPVVVPNGLRLALSNAGIAAPESDEMLAATCEKHIQALVAWVRNRKPFQSAPVVPEEANPDSIQILASARRRDHTVFQWDEDQRNAAADSWNACRAAMLAAAPQPQNAPQNIPEIIPDCWCRTCRPVVLNDMRFVVCPDCGNKRCPRANDHRNACTGSNEPGQEGSAYPDTPREVK
ncbi:hypothetical protein NXH38_02930 [Klebsiella quasipneumoniae]|nr:hypothetical protein [Klebsiella quasipneumoniae]